MADSRDDLSKKIQSILSDEESLKQISELAAMMGLSAPDQAGSGEQSAPSVDEGSAPDIAALASLAGALKSSAAEDDNIRLLMALKPLLHEERRRRVDGAVKILRLINLLPALRESGILGGDLLGIL